MRCTAKKKLRRRCTAVNKNQYLSETAGTPVPALYVFFGLIVLHVGDSRKGILPYAQQQGLRIPSCASAGMPFLSASFRSFAAVVLLLARSSISQGYCSISSRKSQRFFYRALQNSESLRLFCPICVLFVKFFVSADILIEKFYAL